MATRFTHQIRYDAPLVDVAAMLADPQFRESVAAHQQVLRSSVSVQPDGATTTVVVELVHSTARVPSVAKKFVGEEIDIVQREEWSSSDAADVTVTIPGKPAQGRGTIRLVEDADGTTETVEMQVTVSVPLVGGKVEAMVAGLLGKALDAENAVGRDYLSG